MAGLSALATNQRAVAVAAISSAKGSRMEMAASRFSAGVTIAALVRGVTTSTSSGRAAGVRRLRARRMVVPPYSTRPPRDRPFVGEEWSQGKLAEFKGKQEAA